MWTLKSAFSLCSLLTYTVLFSFPLFMKYVLWLADTFFKVRNRYTCKPFLFFPSDALLCAFHMPVVCQIDAIFSLSLFALHALEYIFYHNGPTAVVRENMCPCSCADCG